MAGYSRVTLVGERRRLDVVLPADEQIGSLMPDLLRLLGDRPQVPARLRQIVTVAGEVVPAGATLGQARVPDGAVLRLVAQDEAPPEPVVHDVTEEVAEDTDGRGWRWSPAARRWTATAALAVLLGLGAVLLRRLVPGMSGAVLAGSGALALALAGVALGSAGRHRPGTALSVAAAAVGVLAVLAAADSAGWAPAGRWSAAAGVVAVAVLLLGPAGPLGRGGLLGGSAALLLVAGWAGAAAAGLRADELGAVLGVVSVLVVGVVPRLALAASGLAALDDRRSAGERVPRGDVLVALAAAHRGLALVVVAAAASAALAGVLLADRAGAWQAGLAALLAGVSLARARAFPLLAEVLALVAGGVGVGVALLWAWVRQAGAAPVGPFLVALGAAAAVLVVLVGDPPEHVLARLRRVGDSIETAAVVALVPVAIGVFGVYGELLRSF